MNIENSRAYLMCAVNYSLPEKFSGGIGERPYRNLTFTL